MIYAFGSMLSLLIGHTIMTWGFTHHEPFQAVMMMYGMASALSLAMGVFSPALRQKVRAMKADTFEIMGLILLMAFNAGMFFIALALIGLSGISTLSSATTVMIIMGGVLWFKERLNGVKIALIILTIASTVLFSFSGEIFKTGFWGIVTTLLAGASWACIYFWMKVLSKKVDGMALVVVRTPLITILYIGLFFIACNMGLAQPFTEWPSYTDLFIFALAAFFTTILSYALMPLATQNADLATIAVINALRPLLGFFTGIFLFGEVLDEMKLLAASIGLSSGLAYTIYSFWRLRRPITHSA